MIGALRFLLLLYKHHLLQTFKKKDLDDYEIEVEVVENGVKKKKIQMISRPREDWEVIWGDVPDKEVRWRIVLSSLHPPYLFLSRCVLLFPSLSHVYFASARPRNSFHIPFQVEEVDPDTGKKEVRTRLSSPSCCDI